MVHSGRSQFEKNLLVRGRLLTHDVMQKRNMTCAMSYPAIQRLSYTSSFYAPTYAITIWYQLNQRSDHQLLTLAQTTTLIFANSYSDHMATTGKQKIRRLCSTFGKPVWEIWKYRNAIRGGSLGLLECFLDVAMWCAFIFADYAP